jgi:AcrR family transcriptional regulator
LSAALSVYIRRGYHGADMDAVAEEARMAKGLVYYYYKTKQDLFTELFTLMFDKGSAFSDALLKHAEGMEPVRLLMAYTYGMFRASRGHPRMMQFFLRAPFDAAAVFGPERWRNTARQSRAHREAVAGIIRQGIEEGSIPPVNASGAANSFWSVFVANLFDYAKLMAGTQELPENVAEAFQEAIRFCFQGLGVDRGVWVPCLESVVGAEQEGGPVYEGL